MSRATLQPGLTSSTCCARHSRGDRERSPKVRAMEIIDELEPTRRGVYPGR